MLRTLCKPCDSPSQHTLAVWSKRLRLPTQLRLSRDLHTYQTLTACYRPITLNFDHCWHDVQVFRLRDPVNAKMHFVVV